MSSQLIRKGLPPSIIVAGVIAAVVLRAAAPKPAAPRPAESVPVVQVTELRATSAIATVRATGVVAPAKDITLIPEVTATADNIGRIARFVHDLPGRVPLELINFNPLASGKYYALDRSYDFASITSPLDQDVVETLADVARKEGASVV